MIWPVGAERTVTLPAVSNTTSDGVPVTVNVLVELDMALGPPTGGLETTLLTTGTTNAMIKPMASAAMAKNATIPPTSHATQCDCRCGGAPAGWAYGYAGPEGGADHPAGGAAR